jgi:hypothetical protein
VRVQRIRYSLLHNLPSSIAMLVRHTRQTHPTHYHRRLPSSHAGGAHAATESPLEAAGKIEDIQSAYFMISGTPSASEYLNSTKIVCTVFPPDNMVSFVPHGIGVDLLVLNTL